MKYVAPYVYRVAICDNRIVSVDDLGVTYRVKPSGKRVYETRRLDGEPFVRAFAQHILPPGFRKVRYYGFMSANCKLKLADARWLVWLSRGWTYYLASAMSQPKVLKREPPKCASCGGELEIVGVTDGDGRWLWRQQIQTRGPPETSQSPQHVRSASL